MPMVHVIFRYTLVGLQKGRATFKAQTSLAPLSQFCGSHTTAHEQQCCRCQSYAKYVSPMKLTKRVPHSWDPQRTT